MDFRSKSMGCFAVRDHRGQRIKLSRGQDGSFEVLTTDDADSEALVLYRLLHRSSDPYVPLSTHSSAPSCLPAFESRSERTVAIRHPLSDLYFSSEVGHDVSRSLPANRLLVGEWELFELSDVEIDVALKNDIVLLENFEKSTNKASIIVSAMQRLDFHDLNVVARAHLSIDDVIYDAVASYVMRHPDVLGKLAANLSDPFLNFALLPNLDVLADSKSDWRRPPKTLEVGPEYDFLNAANWGTRIASFWHGINAALRRSIRPSRKLCIVATIRNEGIYILEWIAYHLCRGVEHFFIYTNDNEDGSDNLLSALSEIGLITLIRNNSVPIGASAQSKAYAHALTVLPPVLDFTWCGVIDADEFVVLEGEPGKSLTDLLLTFSDCADALVLRWVTVGSQLQAPQVEQLLVQRCQRVFQDDERVIKSFLRPQRFIHASPHVGAGGGKRPRYLVDASQLLFKSIRPGEMPDPRVYRAISSRCCPTNAVLYHYFYKSPLEFIWKLSRNRGDYPKTVGMAMPSSDLAQEFLAQLKKDSGPSRAMKSMEEVVDRLNHLLDVAAVSDAYRAVLTAFAVRCASMIESFQQAGPAQSPEVQMLLALAFERGHSS